jgi:DNA-binding transcriptional regulator YiaG
MSDQDGQSKDTGMVSTGDHGFAVSMLRDATGLNERQLGRLFDVTQRDVHNWITGSPMGSRYAERLDTLQAVVARLSSNDPVERRQELLDSSRGMSLFHQLVREVRSGQIIQGDAISARDQLGL